MGRALRLLTLGGVRTPGAVVFAYHDIGDDPANSTDYFVSPRRLRQHLTAAKSWGLRFVPVDDLAARFRSGQSLDGLASVVFDDSLVGVHHHAMPVLLDLEVPATVFTVTAELGRQPAWWPGAARVMTAAEVAEMAAAGFDIASHTLHHPSLPTLSDADLRAELVDSKAQLEDLTARPGRTFAYPYGHHDPRVREVVEAAGYEVAFTFLNGRVTSELDPFRLPRLNMYPSQHKARLAYHLARDWPEHQWPVVRDQAEGGPGAL